MTNIIINSTNGNTVALWIGFLAIVLLSLGFQFSPQQQRVSDAITRHHIRWLQILSIESKPQATISAIKHKLHPLKPTIVCSLVVIATLIWWESTTFLWGLATTILSLIALYAAALLMLKHGVRVDSGGPGVAILIAFTGRTVFERLSSQRHKADKH